MIQIFFFFFQIDGGSFKNNKLVIFDNIRNIEKSSPEFYLTYIDKQIKQKSKHSINGNIVEIPVYTNLDRDSLLCSISVQTDENPDVILLSGAAFIIPTLT